MNVFFFFFSEIAKVILMSIVNPLYTDTRYNDKIRYNDNLNATKPSPKRCQLMRNYARILH